MRVSTGLGTGAPIIESPYGDGCTPEEAPESISRAVASLPPEQMFELMKQMKVRIGMWPVQFKTEVSDHLWSKIHLENKILKGLGLVHQKTQFII